MERESMMDSGRIQDLLQQIRSLHMLYGELQLRTEWYEYRIRELEGQISRRQHLGQHAKPVSSEPVPAHRTSLADRQIAALRQELEKKEGAIKELSAVADERLRLLELLPTLQDQLIAKEEEIQRLSAAAEDRLHVIESLQASIVNGMNQVSEARATE